MNYYEARQQLKSKSWCFTYMNDGEIYTDSCCLDHDITGHATKEEAEKCFYNHQVKNLLEFKYQGYEKCQIKGCNRRTNVALGPKGSYHSTYLCKKHRNKEGYMQVNQFEEGITIISS